MQTDLLHALQIVAQLRLETSGDDLQSSKTLKMRPNTRKAANLACFAVFNVLLPIEHPIRDLVLRWIEEDGRHLLQIFFAQLSRAAADVDARLATANVRKAAADALDRRQRERHFAVAIDVRVEHTMDVLEAFRNNKAHDF